NQAYAFNSTGYIQVNNLDPDGFQNGFSFGLWVYPQAPGGWLYWPYTAGWGATFIQWDGQLHFRIGTGSPATDHAVSGISLSFTNWSHLVVTHSQTNDTLYLNGQSVGQWPSLPMQGNAPTLNIGQGYGTGCPGVVDDVVVYGRELSPDEVASLYIG